MAGDADESQKGTQSDAGDRIEGRDSEKESPFDSHELLRQFNDVVGKKKEPASSEQPGDNSKPAQEAVGEAKTQNQSGDQQAAAARGLSSESQSKDAGDKDNNLAPQKVEGADKREPAGGESDANESTEAPRGENKSHQIEQGVDGKDKGTAKPDEQMPEMSDLFSQLDSFDTRGLKKNESRPKGDAASRTPSQRPKDLVDKPAEPVKPAAPQEATSIVGKPANFDPKNPTVAFVDSFTPDDRQNLGRGTDVTHGEFSAGSAEANGFNSFRVQANSGNGNSFAQILENVEKKINTGELPLGKGDVVNISLGNPDLTFEQASQVFGFEINKDNLAQNKDRILEKAKEFAQDQNNGELREIFENIVKSNEAISRLQEKGITVMHAAGNNGPDRFSLEFMNANMQLNSQTDGKPDGFSAAHNLTSPGDGKFKFTREADMTSPTPIRDQRGVVRVEDSNVKFPISGMGNGLVGNLAQVESSNLAQSTIDNLPNPAKLPLPTSVFSSNTDLAPNSFSKSGPKQDFSLRSPSGDPLVKFSYTAKTKNANDQIQVSDQTPAPGSLASGVILGTSFSNIRKLQEMRPQLMEMKKQKQ